MLIANRDDLSSKLFHWSKSDPIAILNEASLEYVFTSNKSSIGIYFLGYSLTGSHIDFQLKYIGKAVDQPIYKRLMQNVRRSHNEKIRENLSASFQGKGPSVYFRFAEFNSPSLAEEVEGLSIAAFLWELNRDERNVWTGWNRRNEWAQHWAEGQE